MSSSKSVPIDLSRPLSSHLLDFLIQVSSPLGKQDSATLLALDLARKGPQLTTLHIPICTAFILPIALGQELCKPPLCSQTQLPTSCRRACSVSSVAVLPWKSKWSSKCDAECCLK